MITQIEKYYRDYYKQFRDNYVPKKLKYIFILESPPISGLYFYKENGKPSESLYLAIMKCVLKKVNVPEKPIGLKEFQDAGYILIDACYIPVNKLNDNLANLVISAVQGNLEDDLDLIFIKGIKTILIKSNIFDIFHNNDFVNRYNVIYTINIPFPSNGNQRVFCKRINNLLNDGNCPNH